MFHFLQQWGAVLIGIFAAISIVAGSQLVLKPVKYPKKGSAVTRIFAFGAGAFFTAVCLDFLPDAWDDLGDLTPYSVFLGALVLWAATHASDGWLEREQSQQLVSASSATARDTDRTWKADFTFTPFSAVILVASLFFHTFLEGAAVSLAFHDMGWKTLGFALAIIVHKLPEGVLWGLALASLFPRNLPRIRRILLIPAFGTLIGVCLGILWVDLTSIKMIHYATGFMAGAMLYIAFAEMLPSLRNTAQKRLARAWFLLGLAVMFSLSILSNVFGG